MADGRFKVELSVGEIVDKMTILKLKISAHKPGQSVGKSTTQAMIGALQSEYRYLYDIAESAHQRLKPLEASNMQQYSGRLQEINSNLWELEDTGRDQINRLGAGTPAGEQAYHVELACTYREIVRQNKRRSEVKTLINRLFNDTHGEVKIYYDRE